MPGGLVRTALMGAAALLLAGGAAPTPAAVTGAGSTFVEPVLSKWIGEYHGPAKLSYQAVGSGAGIELIKARKVDFGASDKPLAPDELRRADLAQFPIVVGGVVPVVNLPGIASGQLHLSGRVLADIFLGKITRWNDPAIVNINRTLRLPNAAIVTVHRSDGSGTTFNWANYLSKVSPEWRAQVGQGTMINWPVGDGESGNDRVAAKVASTANAIGYVEFAFVAKHSLTWACVLNRAGRCVEPNVFSFQAAAEAGVFRADQDFDTLLTDTPGINAYPIAATTFVLLPRRLDPAERNALVDFFGWALDHGGESATHLGYVPLPHSLRSDVEAYWTKNLGR